MRGRIPVWSVCAVAGAVLLAGAAAAVWARVAPPALRGSIVTPPAPTYDFRLRDQENRDVRLSMFGGKVVVMTFLYAHCPDACPLIAEKLREADRMLGSTASRVAFVAVSADPRGDTPEAVRAFLSSHRLTGRLSYLVGPPGDLRRVWAYYYVTSSGGDTVSRSGPGARTSPELIGHTATVYVIDASGNLRVIFGPDFDPADLALDLKILAGSPGRR